MKNRLSNFHLLLFISFFPSGMKFRFKAHRAKGEKVKPTQPDYSNIIKLNQTYFQLRGWMGGLSSSIDFELTKINLEEAKKDRYLWEELTEFWKKHNK